MSICGTPHPENSALLRVNNPIKGFVCIVVMRCFCFAKKSLQIKSQEDIRKNPLIKIRGRVINDDYE